MLGDQVIHIVLYFYLIKFYIYIYIINLLFICLYVYIRRRRVSCIFGASCILNLYSFTYVCDRSKS